MGGGGLNTYLFVFCTLCPTQKCEFDCLEFLLLIFHYSGQRLLGYKQNYNLSYSAGGSAVSQNCTKNKVLEYFYFIDDWRQSTHKHERCAFCNYKKNLIRNCQKGFVNLIFNEIFFFHLYSTQKVTSLNH